MALMYILSANAICATFLMGDFALHIRFYKYVYPLTQGTLCKNLS